MLKSFLAACAVLATGSAAAAGPYVNVENNAAYAGGDGLDMDYMGAVTELHVGIEGGDKASWYAQFGPALISPDNGPADVELSGKVGGSVVVSADEKLSVYGEVSFATVDDFDAPTSRPKSERSTPSDLNGRTTSTPKHQTARAGSPSPTDGATGSFFLCTPNTNP